MPEPTEYYLPLKNIVGVVDVAINPKSDFIYWSDSYEKNSNIGTSNLKVCTYIAVKGYTHLNGGM